MDFPDLKVSVSCLLFRGNRKSWKSQKWRPSQVAVANLLTNWLNRPSLPMSLMSPTTPLLSQKERFVARGLLSSSSGRNPRQKNRLLSLGVTRSTSVRSSPFLSASRWFVAISFVFFLLLCFFANKGAYNAYLTFLGPRAWGADF